MFTLRRLGPADLGLLLDLQERIRSSLPDPDVFQTSTPEFISYCLADGGRCYGVSHESAAVAYRMVYFPRDRDFNLAKDTALPPSEYALVAHWDTIAVLPEWRGHGLARLLNSRALSDVASLDVRHLYATSSPKNPHGIGSLMRAGFRPVRLVRKFGGKLRLLFYRPTPAPWTSGRSGEPERSVPLSAINELEEVLRDGWIGIRLTDDDRLGPCLSLRRHSLPFVDRQS
ncbi:GNAT family N-acetyltransferase [Streptomyces sp. HD]|uniref:GNAT family N-acetyltransferase n=1 Tax=Streptomyces sp. HD TaxID=3020892 RepID=UPI0023309F66|nr:GNAT family N-acetyltransferase [Streptomyces sp. HD]MDC0773762.1 GNAT family N-acetyltransferase [Streptomyces sp. HD]